MWPLVVVATVNPFEHELINKKIREWLGWESIGLVVTNSGDFIEHFSHDEIYEVRRETRKVKRIIPFHQLPEWCYNLDEMLIVIEDTPLKYQFGKLQDNKYFANVCNQDASNTVDIVAESLSYALSKAFVEYLNRFGTSWL